MGDFNGDNDHARQARCGGGARRDEIEGMGLGLAIVKGVIERHGGTIAISTSRPGHERRAHPSCSPSPAGMTGRQSVAPAARTRYDTVMDFERVLKALLTELERHHIRYAAIGGFALGALGAERTTKDLDLLIDRDDLDRVHTVMNDLGYLRYAQTANVTHYRHPDAEWVSVDVIHALRRHAREMLSRAKLCPIFRNTLTLRVAEPEDVIGFKVQAIANNPDRRLQDQADIERLMAIYRDRLDWKRLHEYYDLFGMGDEAQRLQERFGHAQ